MLHISELQLKFICVMTLHLRILSWALMFIFHFNFNAWSTGGRSLAFFVLRNFYLISSYKLDN